MIPTFKKINRCDLTTLQLNPMTKAILLNLLILFGFLSTLTAQQSVAVSSPDGKINFDLSINPDGMSYKVSFNGTDVIERSVLEISVDQKNITTGVRHGNVGKYTVDESYPWYGAHALAVNHGNGLRIPLQYQGEQLSYTLEVRAYNDGVAFRWIIPESNASTHIPDEATQFRIPTGSETWYHNLRGHYEGVYATKMIDTVQAGEWAAPPVTFKLPDHKGYASITEANLVGYGGMALQTDAAHGFTLRLPQHQPVSYPYELRYSKEEVARSQQPASIHGTITTPWRVIMVGASLNDMVNSDLVHNLCPPPDKTLFPQGIKTSWVRPGKAVWKYLGGGGPSTPDNMKRFSKLAGELGFQYNILEGFWSRWSDDTIRNLIDYSKQQGVGIWVWEHSKNLRDPEARHRFFQRCHDLGVTGVKIDFFDSEAKYVIDLYDSILHETAALHLLVNFHGANKPTGLERTWPNELNREAVKGMESRSLKDRATHATILPFTRYLAGPADYTPVIFNERRANTTYTNQVASAVILGAPLLTFAANPDSLIASPCRKMIERIPPTWDQTVVLPPSAIGQVVIFARRKGKTWFLAAMNGAADRKFEIPLSFLSKGSYQTVIFQDTASNPAVVEKETRTTDASQKIIISMGEGGGFIARFDPR